jgi:hypothetical protein
MKANQPQRKPASSWIFVLTGCVLIALATAALHLGFGVRGTGNPLGAQQAPGASLLLVNASAGNSNLPALSEASRRGVAAGYGLLPLAFEANQGQTDAQVKYLARGAGYTLFLTADGAVLSLASDSVLRMRMAGSNPNSHAAADDRLPGVSNYFIGNDPHRWRTNVAQYARVEYQDVYPGVNLAFHGDRQQLQFDFVLAGGADPSPINLSFSGAQRLATDDSGNLVLSTSAGDLRVNKPGAYQEENGARHPVDARFVVKDDQRVGFALGNYDRSRELVIDPTLSYSTASRDAVLPSNATASLSTNSGPWMLYVLSLPVFGLAILGAGIAPRKLKWLGLLAACLVLSGLVFLPACGSSKGGGLGGCAPNCPSTSTLVYSSYLGGTKDDAGQAIAVDSNGNAYVAGESSSTDFPGSPAFAGGTGHDAFVVKVDASGTRQYSTFIGGTGDDDALGIALVGGTKPVIVGNTQHGTGFPATTTLGVGGGQDAFVAELDASGSLAGGFSTVIGGSGLESGNAVAVDGSGDIYIAGQTNSTNFPLQTPFQPANAGGNDAFVAKLNSTGTALLYSTYLGGSSSDLATGIAVNTTDNTAYVSGITDSSGLQLGAGGTSLKGPEDGFVAKFDANGSEVYFTYVGGSAGDDADAIAIDSTGAYVTGKTQSNDLPQKQNSLHGTQDAFVTKVNTDGTIAFSTYLGGATAGGSGGDADEGLGIAVNAGNIFVTGVTTTTDFPVVNALTGSSSLKGGSDAFVTEFAATGATPVFSTFFGGSAHEDNLLVAGSALAGAIAVDSTGNIYVTGSTNSPTNFPLQNPFQVNFAGTGNCGAPAFPCPDAFVAKITP